MLHREVDLKERLRSLSANLKRGCGILLIASMILLSILLKGKDVELMFLRNVLGHRNILQLKSTHVENPIGFSTWVLFTVYI